MNQIQTEVIFLNLLRQADEFVFSIVGTNPAGDAGSLRARVVTLFADFKADKAAFVANQTKIGFLAMLLKEYASLRLSPIDTLGTPEILSPVVRWTEIEEMPDVSLSGHTHQKADISDFPATMTPDAHTHTKAQISDFPATMTPDAHTHTKSEISDFPATMTPDAHTHTKAQISDFPATMPPTTHQHTKSEISDFPATLPPAAHQHTKNEISDFPATLPPTAHQHTKNEISDFPATLPPTAHPHVKADITDLPFELRPISQVYWLGNGAANRVISLSSPMYLGDLITSAGFYGRISSTGSLYKVGASIETGAFIKSESTLTIISTAYNVAGVSHNLLTVG